jgi:large subunit ribosomal protein L24
MTQPKFKIKKGDQIQVISGSHKGERGVVKRVYLDKASVVVENINVVTRHVKPDYKHPQGTHKKEMPVHISNVSLIDPSTDSFAKTGYKVDDSGKKVRYFKKSGVVL